MRKLSNKQKKLVKEYYEKYNYLSYSQLVNQFGELINNLEKINDYETLWRDVSRLIGDLIMNDNLDIKNWS